MAFKKYASSKYRRVYIAGIGTLLALFTFLAGLGFYGVVIETSPDITCAGTVDNPCVSFINITTNEYGIKFPTGVLYFGDNPPEKYELYKADLRYKSDNPARWKAFDISGKTMGNESKWELKLVGYKNKSSDVVKWGIKYGGVDKDPYWFGSWITKGNNVYMNDSKAFINVNPHTLTGSNTIRINATAKTYTGNIDLIFGFDTDFVKPESARIYNPKTWNETLSYSCNSPYWYNYTLTPKVFYCWQNLTTMNNVTHVNTTSFNLIFSHAFETANLGINTAYWNESRSSTFDDITNKFTKENYDYGGMNTWYIANNLPVVAGTPYYFEGDVKVVPRIGYYNYKYWVCLKPSSQSIQQANDSGSLYCLDPWALSNYAYKKQINITAASTLPAGYTINATLDMTGGHFLNTGNDTRVVIDDGTNTLEINRNITNNGTANSLLEFKLNSQITGGTSNASYYIYYGNPSAGNPPNNRTNVYWDWQDAENLANNTNILGAIGYSAHNGNAYTSDDLSIGTRSFFWSNPGSDPNRDVLLYFGRNLTYSNYTISMKMAFKQNIAGHIGIGYKGNDTSATASFETIRWSNTATDFYCYTLIGGTTGPYCGPTPITLAGNTYNTNYWNALQVDVYNDSKTTKQYFNNTLINTAFTELNTNGARGYGLSGGYSPTPVYFDNIMVRLLVPSNPTITIGAEQTANSPPQWSNNQSSIGATSYFNTTWTDDIDANGFNFSFTQIGFLNGTLSNYTSWRFPLNISHFNITSDLNTISNWTMYANDSSNSWNKTNTVSFSYYLLNGLAQDRKYEYGTKANINWIGSGTYCIGTDLYSESNLTCGASPLIYNYTVGAYWNKNFSNNSNPLRFNLTSANFTSANNRMVLNLSQIRNLTNSLINITGFNSGGSYPFNSWIDVLSDGVKDLIFPGYLVGNVLNQTYLSNGLSSEKYPFVSAGSVVRYINYTTLTIDGIKNSMYNLTFSLWGEQGNTESIDFTENLTASGKINLTSSNTTWNYWVYDDMSIGKVPNRWVDQNTTKYTYSTVLGNYITMNTSLIMGFGPACGQNGTFSDSGTHYGRYRFQDIDIKNYNSWKASLSPVYSVYKNGCGGTYHSQTVYNIYAGVYDGTNYYTLTDNPIPTAMIWTLNISDNYIKSYQNDVYKNQVAIDSSKNYSMFFYVDGRIYYQFNGGDCGGSPCDPNYYSDTLDVELRTSQINASGSGARYTGSLANLTSGRLESNNVFNFTGTLLSAKLTANDVKPSGTAIQYYLSANNGTNWEATTSGNVLTFSNVGRWLKWKAEIYNTSPNINATAIVKSLNIMVTSGNATNISIDIGADGSIDWNYPTQLNSSVSPQTVQISDNTIISYITTNCGSALTCLVPIKITSASSGTLNITNISGKISLSNINLLYRNSSLINNHLTNNNLTNITFGMTNGTIEVKDLVFTYPKDFNITVTAFNILDRLQNVTRTIMARYSQYNLTYPTSYQKIGGFKIKTNNDTNLTPFGQSDTIPIWNITASRFNTDPFNLAVKLNEAPNSCLNFKANNISYAGNATNLSTTYKFIQNNTGVGVSKGVWWWLDLSNCGAGMIQLTNRTIRTVCTDCVWYP